MVPLTLIGVTTGELQNVLAGDLVDPSNGRGFALSTASVTALLASCVCGVGMSYSGFRLRKEVCVGSAHAQHTPRLTRSCSLLPSS